MPPEDRAGSRAVVLLLRCPGAAAELRQAGLAPRAYESPTQLFRRARGLHPRACIVHADALREMGGEESIRRLRQDLPLTDVLVWAPRASARLVRDVLRAGAIDVVLSGHPEQLAQRAVSVIAGQRLLPRVLEFDRTEPEAWQYEGMVSRSRTMWDIFQAIERTATTPATVLILGETGTGKELVARAIHRRSGREGRFVALNCGAVPEGLIESELFGHTRGAFTGADQPKQGLFRHADGGTLFLDEIGNIPLAAQFSLLRALQADWIRPVGGHEEVSVDVRVIAASSNPLDEAVRRQTFREDLLYRLDVIRCIIPPLRERPEDIIFLFSHFLGRFAERYNVPRPEVSEEFLDALQSHAWPGNVRELENFVERLLLTQRSGRQTARTFRRLMRPFRRGASDRHTALPAHDPVDTSQPLAVVVEAETRRIERRYLESCLRQHRGRMADSAQQAGISRRTLLRKLQLHDLDRLDYREVEVDASPESRMAD